MKTRTAILSITTAFALTLPLAGAMAQCTNPPSGLAGWWSGDGHFFDLVGTNHAIPQGDVAFAEGKVNRAFLFAGNAMTVPANPAYNCNQASGDFTVACWIRPDSTAWECLLNNGQWTFFLYQDMLGFARLTEGNPFHTVAGATPVGQWSHIAVTRNGTTYRIWVNGAEAVATSRGDIPASVGALTIAADAYGAWYNGRMDELTVFNRGLSASEMMSLYTAGSYGMCPPSAPPGPVDFSDDFSTGLNTNLWSVICNDSTMSLLATNGELRLSRPAGGNYNMHYMEITFGRVIQGDFDASVDIRNASITRVDGSPGNQIQLNTGFGGQYLCVVRSDETGGGQNAHVWRDPPSSWAGTISTTASSGTLRVTRAGSAITTYFGGTLLHSGTYNASPVTYLALALQNNGTRDAISVTFDNFRLRAAHLVPAPVRMQALGGNGSPFQVRLLNPTPGAWHWLEYSPVLPAAGGWSIQGLMTGGAFPTNWSDPMPLQTPVGFYRVRSQ